MTRIIQHKIIQHKRDKNFVISIFFRICATANFLLLIAYWITGCAQIPPNNLPGSVRTIYVQMFSNDTFQYGMEEKLTNAVVKELIMDKRLQVVNNPATADVVLSGTITNYTQNILATDRSGEVDLYSLSLTASFTLKDTRTNEIIRQRKAVLATTTYVPKRSRIEYENEQDARTRLITDLADEIVARIFEK
ncbi:MAG: LPS assembly lipoprotein LptE [bacterium]|nr:LPS assembly lipoprotein LptE [bacterium]